MGAPSDLFAGRPQRATPDRFRVRGVPAGPHERVRARLLGGLADEPALRARPSSAPPDEDVDHRPPASRVAFLRTGSGREADESMAPALWASWRERLRAVCAPLARLRARLRGLRAEVRVPAQVGTLGVITYLVLLNFSVVRGSSMSPGIRDGDRILIDQVSYLFRDVQRGDVVVLRYPLDPTVEYIKRVVGLPGDDVVIRSGEVIVNGVTLDEPYVQAADSRAFLSTIVQPGHYFVLGDNRPQSADSREFGQIPRALVRGKVDLRVWPFGRVGLID